MRVGIVTIVDGQNYGNRLQNYALQETLKGMNIDVYTLKRKSFHNPTFLKSISIVLKRCIKRIINRPYGKYRLIREKKFAEFNDKYISFDKTILHDNVSPHYLSNRFDYFVVGSDQVWNAGFRIIKEDLLNYLAHFAKPRQRISYAASFGTDKIAEGFESIFKEELSKFKAISLREDSGIEILKELGLSGKVVLDPTMLLTAEKWRSIEKKPRYIDDNEKFLLTYFLGKKNEDTNKFIDSVAGDMRIITLQNDFINEEDVVNLEYYATSPDEFIWLISHSECIITDSFHGAVFSMIFHRPFWVFDRTVINDSYKMGSRLETLLGKFQMDECKASLNVQSSGETHYDYEKIDKILRIERDNSIAFLRNALEI